MLRQISAPCALACIRPETHNNFGYCPKDCICLAPCADVSFPVDHVRPPMSLLEPSTTYKRRVFSCCTLFLVADCNNCGQLWILSVFLSCGANKLIHFHESQCLLLKRDPWRRIAKLLTARRHFETEGSCTPHAPPSLLQEQPPVSCSHRPLL
jgi:hypothetical protein